MSEHKYTDEEVIKAFDILDKFEFFGGQRAGRELWFDKPTDIQNKDIGDFLRDLDFLKQFISRQNAEISALTSAVDNSTKEFLNLHDEYKVQKEMIERLTKAIEVQEIMLENHDRKIKATKAEAIKEFAEWLEALEEVVTSLKDGEPITAVETYYIHKFVKEFTEEKT